MIRKRQLSHPSSRSGVSRIHGTTGQSTSSQFLGRLWHKSTWKLFTAIRRWLRTASMDLPKPIIQLYLTNLIALQLTGCVDEGRSVAVVYLDFSKAFYTTLHSIITAILVRYRLEKWTITWVKNWLKMCQSAKSKQRPVISGIPQVTNSEVNIVPHLY